MIRNLQTRKYGKTRTNKKKNSNSLKRKNKKTRQFRKKRSQRRSKKHKQIIGGYSEKNIQKMLQNQTQEMDAAKAAAVAAKLEAERAFAKDTRLFSKAKSALDNGSFLEATRLFSEAKAEAEKRMPKDIISTESNIF